MTQAIYEVLSCSQGSGQCMPPTARCLSAQATTIYFSLRGLRGNKKRGQQDKKFGGKLVQNASKWFWWKTRTTLDQIISGTKCDRDKLIFYIERRVNKIELVITKVSNGIGKCQKKGSMVGKFPSTIKYGSSVWAKWWARWAFMWNLIRRGGAVVGHWSRSS